MADIYFKIGDTIFNMDATTEVSGTLSATLSSSPMQDGTNQSDNIVVDTPTCSMSGIITDIKDYRQVDTKNTGNWIDLVNSAINSKVPVFLKQRADKAPESGWVVTSFTHTQTKGNGVGGETPEGKIIQSFQISINFTRPILAKGLQRIPEPDVSYLDALQVKTSKSSTTSQFDTKNITEKKNYETSFARAEEHRQAIKSITGGN